MVSGVLQSAGEGFPIRTDDNAGRMHGMQARMDQRGIAGESTTDRPEGGEAMKDRIKGILWLAGGIAASVIMTIIIVYVLFPGKGY